MIGIDIVEIERIKKSLENPRFLERIFTQEEISYFAKREYKVDTIAGVFAAKEAVSKALGTGIRGFTFKDIQITHSDIGMPMVNLYREAYELSKNKTVKSIQLSISHEKNYAVAVAILCF